MRQFILALLAALMLVACGQKGLLYIPEPTSADSSQDSKKKEPAPDEEDK